MLGLDSTDVVVTLKSAQPVIKGGNYKTISKHFVWAKVPKKLRNMF